MNRPQRLSASFVERATPGTKTRARFGDGRGGHGLSLLVRRTANGRLSKTWAQRLRVRGKVVSLGLGNYPIVSLAGARALAVENAARASRGEDPRRETSPPKVPTFAEMLERTIELHAQEWTHHRTEHAWRSSMERFALPLIGHLPVDEIGTREVIAVLTHEGFWHKRRATAMKVRQRIGAVMKLAVAEEWRGDNPAGDVISTALPKGHVRTRHHRALHHRDVAEALEKVEGDEPSWIGARLCLRFLILTGCRSGEARGMEWREYDPERAVWTIPARRTKTRRPHRIPLSPAAVEVLDRARDCDRLMRGDGALVFPARRGGMQTDVMLSRITKRHDLATVHGFRSSLRDWCAETDVSFAVAEAILGHRERSAVVRAYRRTDLLDARREVMDAWAAYVTG